MKRGERDGRGEGDKWRGDEKRGKEKVGMGGWGEEAE